MDKKDFATAGAAGLLGITLMDTLVNFPVYYLLESKRTLRKEKSAQVFDRWAPEAAATLLSKNFFSVHLNENQSLVLGRTIHFATGAAFAIHYLILLKQSRFLQRSAGIPFCFFLILFDEVLTHLLGFTSRPSKYPWQAHLRGILSNTVLGLSTHVFLIKMMSPSLHQANPVKTNPQH